MNEVNKRIDYRWFIWVIGWLITFGMLIANSAPGIVYSQLEYAYALIMSFFSWPVFLGYYIFKFGFQ
jgi:hypothetical protein